MYCQVIVDIVHENVDRPFTYLIPAGLHVEAGQRVTVPFGKQEKEGMVLELTEECSLPPERIRSVCRTLEDYPAVPAELIGCFNLIFYSSAEDAVFKALGVE